MLDYINTNTFRDLSDFVIMLNNNKPFTFDILKQNAIIFCKTDYLDYLFSNIQFSGRKYILITHASDYPITKILFNKKPNCIKKWFGENIAFSHPDLISIPIGLSPDKDVDETPLDIKWFSENIERFREQKKSLDILYCNWTTNNNIAKRKDILNKFDRNNIKYIWDYPTFTKEQNELIQQKFKVLKEGKSTKEEISKLLHYYEYCENMSKYKFVISPPGNGEDCHRTWEALYMGFFPVVLKGDVFNDYKDNLPIIQVNNYSEVTYHLLYSYLDKEYNYEKLYMKYWEERILEEFKNL